MREFVLIDLRSQMPFLPLFMKKWRRNKLLAWLKIYGELRVFGEWQKSRVEKISNVVDVARMCAFGQLPPIPGKDKQLDGVV